MKACLRTWFQRLYRSIRPCANSSGLGRRRTSSLSLTRTTRPLSSSLQGAPEPPRDRRRARRVLHERGSTRSAPGLPSRLAGSAVCGVHVRPQHRRDLHDAHDGRLRLRSLRARPAEPPHCRDCPSQGQLDVSDADGGHASSTGRGPLGRDPRARGRTRDAGQPTLLGVEGLPDQKLRAGRVLHLDQCKRPSPAVIEPVQHRTAARCAALGRRPQKPRQAAAPMLPRRVARRRLCLGPQLPQRHGQD